MHASHDFEIYPSIWCGLLTQVILVNHFVRNIRLFYSAIFKSLEWLHEVEVGEVSCGKFGLVCQYDAVKKDFNQKQIGSEGSDIFGIVNEVASKSSLDSVGILFLCSNRRHKLDVSNIFKSVLWYFMFVNEEYGVCAINSSANSLS